MKRKIEFNNGFLIAISLFLEHKNKYKGTDKNNDLRIYAASDHLADLEIPDYVSKRLKRRIKKAVNYIFKYRLLPMNNKEADGIFKEFEDIMIELDKELFNLKDKVYYR